MNVRPAAMDDADAISVIATQTFHLACPPDTPEVELTRYAAENLTPECFRSALSRADLRLLVVENEQSILGFSLITASPENIDIPAADGIPELTRCYVSADQHGTGAAQLLISETLATVTSDIRLTVNDQNPRAIRFYQRNGFEQVGETTFVCGADLHRDLVMVRPFPGI
jgi:diamine N-acetyltransferase